MSQPLTASPFTEPLGAARSPGPRPFLRDPGGAGRGFER